MDIQLAYMDSCGNVEDPAVTIPLSKKNRSPRTIPIARAPMTAATVAAAAAVAAPAAAALFDHLGAMVVNACLSHL